LQNLVDNFETEQSKKQKKKIEDNWMN